MANGTEIHSPLSLSFVLSCFPGLKKKHKKQNKTKQKNSHFLLSSLDSKMPLIALLQDLTLHLSASCTSKS